MPSKMRLSLIILLALAVYEVSALNPFTLKRFGIDVPLRVPQQRNQTEKYDDVQEKWMDQKLDHFNAARPQNWTQRYLENLDQYASGGPILIFLDGEWVDLHPQWLQVGQFYDVGVELKAAMYYIEHRFYGQSKPTSDTAPWFLQYLNAEQQLADIANFIVQLKQQNPDLNDAKVLLVGAGTAGNLATWFRQKYPELVSGVWAPDAYLYATVDFKEYMVGTGYALRKVHGDYCYRRVEEAFSTMANMVLNENVLEINRRFNLCDPITKRDPLNLANFFYIIADVLSWYVQYNKDNFTIREACEKVTDTNYTDGFTAYAAFINSHLNGTCLNANYDKDIAFYKQPQWQEPAVASGARQYLWQQCNEYGRFPSTTSKNQPFGNLFPLKLFYRICYDVFFERFRSDFIDGNIQYTNDLYGGFEPQVTNVYFTLGELDPAHVLGIQRPLNEKTFAFVIPGMSALVDLESVTDDDTYEIRLSKQRVIQLFKKWISTDN